MNLLRIHNSKLYKHGEMVLGLKTLRCALGFVWKLQWIGNLVSPKWWNDDWAMKGVVAWLKYKALAALKPSWNVEGEQRRAPTHKRQWKVNQPAFNHFLAYLRNDNLKIFADLFYIDYVTPSLREDESIFRAAQEHHKNHQINVHEMGNAQQSTAKVWMNEIRCTDLRYSTSPMVVRGREEIFLFRYQLYQ